MSHIHEIGADEVIDAAIQMFGMEAWLAIRCEFWTIKTINYNNELEALIESLKIQN